VEADQLSAVIHPQSIIHALVYYSDGSVIAQASLPDMRTPIAYSLAWPGRLEADFKRLDLAAAGTLTFDEPDPARFPALRLAKDSLRAGGAAPTVLNAANEIAVEAFLNKSTPFMGIAALVERTLSKAASELSGVLPDSLDAVMYLDGRAREIAKTALLDQSGASAGASAYSVPI
jgi:1-deoxy-D-xylulose-5-phosphate reductoisomerase